MNFHNLFLNKVNIHNDKRYLRDPQCSPKGGMIPNRVRHLFISLASLYLPPPGPYCGSSPVECCLNTIVRQFSSRVLVEDLNLHLSSRAAIFPHQQV